MGTPSRLDGEPRTAHAAATLPNGLEIAFQSRAELGHFYDDIFRDQVYLRGGLKLPPRAVVLDVGANVGLFTVFAALRSPGARIFAFEPAPPLFRCLSANARRYAPQARLFDLGVSDRTGVAELRFYPGSSGMSSFHADPTDERAVLRSVVENEARMGKEAALALTRVDLDGYLDERLRSIPFECRLVSLGQVLREERIERVDLLKIDVQKSELEVLLGLGEEDWPRIRQVAIEVHDLDGRVETVRRLLEERGHQVAVEQEALYQGSNVYLVYGRRRSLPGTRIHAAGDGARTDPDRERSQPPRRPCFLLVWSAASSRGLQRRTEALGACLPSREVPEVAAPDPLEALAATLQAAPPPLPHRRWAVVRPGGDAPRQIAAGSAGSLHADPPPSARRPALAFLFPGLGNHHPATAAGLLAGEPDLRREVLECCEILRPELGSDLTELFDGLTGRGSGTPPIDLRRALRRGPQAEPAPGAGILRDTRVAHPALFVLELALARLWMTWGVRPDAMLGYSLGELVAACIAGVFEREDALRLVARRARLVGDLPEGRMIAVSAAREELDPWIGAEISVCVEVGPQAVVLGGPPQAVEEVEADLAARQVVHRRLETSHAFHCELLRPAFEPLVSAVASIARRPPEIPWLSNLTGGWITAEEAMDPVYWGRHLVSPVRFDAALTEIWREPGRALLEVGPAGALGPWALQHPAAERAGASPLVLTSLPLAFDGRNDHEVLLGSLGRLWAAGVAVDWDAFHGERTRDVVELPAAFLAAEGGEDTAAPETRSSEEGSVKSDANCAVPPEEVALTAIWCRVLGRPEVRRDVSFFDIGGDSLRAVRLLSACERELGVRLTLRDLFDAPTLVELAALVSDRLDPSPAVRRPEPALPVARSGAGPVLSPPGKA